MKGVEVLIGVDIDASMFKAGTTVAEPDVARGEAAWVPEDDYHVDDEVLYQHAIYSCVADHSGETTTPDLDTDNWLYERPSNRFAPFDFYISTKTLATGSLTYVMQPGFFTDVSLYGIEGDHLLVRVKDAPGGAVTKELDVDLWEQALGLYELLFMPLRRATKASLDDIPLSPTAELTITVTGGAGAQVGFGYAGIGSWAQVIGASAFGGTEQGAEAEPKSYAFVKYNDDGTYQYKKRRSATNLSLSVVLSADAANSAYALLEQILDKPLPVRVGGHPRYAYLNTVGVVSGRVRDANNAAVVPISVKGFI